MKVNPISKPRQSCDCLGFYIDKSIDELTNFYGDNDFLFPYKTIYKSPKDIYLDGYILEPLYQFKELNNVNEDKIKILLKSRELLEKFHNKYNYIHTDICPWNYMYKKETDELVLIDFDTAINLKETKNINLDLILTIIFIVIAIPVGIYIFKSMKKNKIN